MKMGVTKRSYRPLHFDTNRFHIASLQPVRVLSVTQVRGQLLEDFSWMPQYEADGFCCLLPVVQLFQLVLKVGSLRVAEPMDPADVQL